MTFAELRKKHGYTQKGIADILEINQSTVCLWEKGKTAPNRKTANKVAELFACTIDEIFKSIEAAAGSEVS